MYREVLVWPIRVSRNSVYVFLIASHFNMEKAIALKLCLGNDGVDSYFIIQYEFDWTMH